MATDEEIKELVEKSIKEYRASRVSKVFRDPIKAENVSFILGMILLISVMINVITLGSPSLDTATYSHLSTLQFKHMTCHEVKALLQDIENEPQNKFIPTLELQNQILSKC